MLLAAGSDTAAPSRRTRKIIESSPPPPSENPQESGTTTAAAAAAASADEQLHQDLEAVAGATEPVPEIEESQQTEAENRDTPSLKALIKEGFVARSSPPSSYLAGEYQRIVSRPVSRDEDPRPSQSSPSPALGISSLHQASTVPPEDSTQKSTNSTSLVIPDSQSQGAIFEESTSKEFSPTQRSPKSQFDQEYPHEPLTEEPPQSSPQSSIAAVEAAQLLVPSAITQGSDRPSLGSATAEVPHSVSSSRAAAATNVTAENPELVIAEEAGLALAQSRAVSNSLVRRSEGLTATEPAIAKQPEKSPSGSDSASTAQEAPDLFPPTESSRSQDQAVGLRQVIVISSTEDQSDQSAVLDFDSSNRDTDFEPPPAAQRPLPSSLLNKTSQVKCPGPSQINTVEPLTQQQDVSQVETPVGLSQSHQEETRRIHYYGSSQSFPFQTQIHSQTTPRKLGSPINSTHTPGSKALFMPTADPDRRSSVAHFSRSLESTPFPSLPRDPLGALGESAPARLSLSSREGPTMESTPTPKRETLAEKIKRSREARIAARASATPVPSVTSSLVDGSIEHAQPASALPPNLIAEVAVAQAARLGSPFASLHDRSPSAIPAVEEIAPITREEMTTSERYETLLPQAQAQVQAQAQAQNSSKIEADQNSTLTSAANNLQDVLGDPELASIHVVPIAPSAFQRDQYQNNIYFEKKLIEQVMNTGGALNHETLVRTNKFLETLRKIALHPDLINPETLSQTTENEIQAKWDIKTSAKFEFLNEFIRHVSDHNIHVAVVAHGERIPTMLHNFFQGIKVPCKRWLHPSSTDPDLSPVNLGVKVSIIDLDGGLQNVERADVVIAMDPLVDYRHPLVRAARNQTGDQDKWSLLLPLVLPHTLEHIERSLQADLPPSIRTKILAKATNEFRWEAGRLESTQSPLKHAASAIAEFLDDTSADWPIAALSQLDEMDSQTESDLQADSHGVKRSVDDTGTNITAETKRARLNLVSGTQLPTTINPLELDITHVSDSLDKGTESNMDMVDAPGASPSTEQRLREILQGVQDRLDEHVKALEDLQYRHEDQRKHLVEVKKERDAARLAAEAAHARMAGAEANNATLRIERTQLKEALAEAKSGLLSHAVPEMRELEAVRMSAEAAKLEEEKARKKSAAAEKELEWTRSMYQDSSNRARELAQNNAELETRLALASHTAQGEQARAREISIQGHNKALEQECQKLTAQLENCRLALKNKDEQIASLKEGRGRIGTRGSSVPRSPRMGSPMKGRVSRQPSPAAAAAADSRGRGAHLHPLRNSAGT